MSRHLCGRSRWAALGAVVAVLFGGGSLLTASAAGSPLASSFVPVTPCRLFDTRAGSDNIGPRSTPLGPNETFITAVWGTNGNCTIPSGATGVSISVAIINPTSPSFLTVFPADASRPLSSNLNWVAGQAPTPNGVTAALSADGRLGLYNLAGTVDLLVDIVGYYELSTSGPAGPPGPPGVRGDRGDPGPRPAQIVWVAKSGGDFTSLSAALASIIDNSSTKPYLVRIAPGVYTEAATVFLKDYVDVEGSGEGITTITCGCSNSDQVAAAATIATLTFGDPLHIQVRDLSVTTTGGGFNTYAIFTGNATSAVSFDHVTATASGGNLVSGIFNAGSQSSATFTNVTATATGGSVADGISNLGTSSASTFTNVTATASGAPISRGLRSRGGVVIRDSFISGTTDSVFKGGADTIHIADTVLSGATTGVGAANCVNTLTTSLTPFTCT